MSLRTPSRVMLNSVAASATVRYGLVASIAFTVVDFVGFVYYVVLVSFVFIGGLWRCLESALDGDASPVRGTGWFRRERLQGRPIRSAAAPRSPAIAPRS